MGYEQKIHHFVVCDLCGRRQEIRECDLESDNFGRIIPPIPPCNWARKLICGEAAYMCPECQRKVSGIPLPLEFDCKFSLLQRNGWEYNDEAGRTFS